MVGWLKANLIAAAVMVGLWALLVILAARRVPREVLMEAWPGEPRLLERLIGTPGQAADPTRDPRP